MSYLSLLTVCFSLILGVCGVASIFVAGWVKSSKITDLETSVKSQTAALSLSVDKQVTELRADVNKLWENISKVEVLSTRMGAVEKGIDEIKDMLRAH